METNLPEMMRRALVEVMETPAPDCAEDDNCNAALVQRRFGLAGTGTSFAKLCMCALVDTCLKGDVQGIKQVMALGSATAEEGSPIGGVLNQLREHMAATDDAGE